MSPDEGGVKRANRVADKMGLGLAIIHKERSQANIIDRMELIGNVSGKIVVMIDDMIDTAGTICNAAVTAMEKGAKSVTAIATHPVLSGPSIERLQSSPISKVVVCDTIDLEAKRLDKLEVISVADVFGESIKRIVDGTSLSSMFDF